MKNILLLVLLGFVTFLSCKKENFETFSPHIGSFETKTVTASFSGIIVDKNQKGLEGVTVTSANNTTTTDENGVFFFQDILVTNSKAYFKANKPGYFHGSRTVFAQADKTHQIRIKMLPNNSIGSFNNASGGEVVLPQGGKLKFDGGDIAFPNGNPYTGIVNVSAQRIDPTQTNGQFEMPGDLRGIDSENKNVVLHSYGMMAVELRDNSGNLLQVAPDQTVEMSFEIPSTLTGSAPETIPLWYFDEQTGDWKEEGSASLLGNTYQGEVSHFSFWNCDAPFPTVYFEATFVDEEGNPIANRTIRLLLENNWVASGITNADGWIGGLIPANSILKLYISTDCGTMFIQDISSSDTDINLGTMTITSLESIVITGTLTDCEDNLVTSGYLLVGAESWFGVQAFQVSTDNNFSFNYTLCNGVDSISIIGVDILNLQKSQLSSFPINNNTNVGVIKACDNAISEFWQLNFTLPNGGDTTITLLPPFLHFYEIMDTVTATKWGVSYKNSGDYVFMKTESQYGIGSYPCNGLIGLILNTQDTVEINYLANFQIISYPENVDDYLIGTMLSDGSTPKVTGNFVIKRTE